MRLSAAERRAQILAIALTIAERNGLRSVTAETVSAAGDFSAGTVRRYFLTQFDLRRAVTNQSNISFELRHEAMDIGLIGHDTK